MIMQRKRPGYTLIELLVVISLIAVLAALTMAFYPSAAASARESRAGMNLQGWLNVAKQRALRDQAPRGLRLWISSDPALPPNSVTDCQYLEQPDDFTGGQIVSGTPVPAPLPAAGYSVLNTLGFTTADPTNGSGVANLNNMLDPGMPYWSVQPGDYLQLLGGGVLHQVIQVGAPNSIGGISRNYIKISPPVAYPAALTANYRIIRAPRPTGDEMLKLPEGTIIDTTTNLPAAQGGFNNPLPPIMSFQGGAFVDIMFGPSGAVISPGVMTTSINLWVRAPSPTNPLDPYSGDPSIIAVFVKTGFTGAFNPAPVAMGPYAFVK